MYVAYSTANYKYLLDTMYQGGITEGYMRHKIFPDGEVYHQLDPSEIIDKDVLIVGGTHAAQDTLDIFDIGCSVVKHGARSLTIFIPYYGYSTMERATKPGEIVKAKTRARLLSSIPSGARPNRVIFLDLHTEGIPHYLEGNIQPIHLYAKNIIIDACNNIAKSFVLGSTDAGRAKWIESLANDMNVDCAIITKRRNSGSDTEITSINADVKDKTVIIYDDMIRTGGSVIKAAEKYVEAGAKTVHVIATHGVLPGISLKKLFASSAISSVTVTDSHPRAAELFSQHGFYRDYPSIYPGANVNFKVIPIAHTVCQELINNYPI